MGENYSNADGKSRIQYNAKENLNTFLSCDEQMTQIESQEATISNVKYMKDRLKLMVTNGSINKDEWEYKLLDAKIETAAKYLENVEPLRDDSYKHYAAFRDFEKIASVFLNEGGGGNV
ncbi:hypothetical protein [Priestia megaterium]|uniref:hypothetical protein n=1 Tax=Priestia megaterium TaxID=1404 RepID=UPI002FFF5909